jgi:prepilin signal peptidase PulO-like enzyme (type II secretory pathway)
MPLADLPLGLLACVLGPFGLAFGSFANVLIHRLPKESPRDRNVVTKPSHCPSCGRNIRWFHNVPVFSWVFLRGRCAHCGWAIPLRYPAVELLTGLLFGLSPFFFPFGTLIWLKGVLCGYALIVLFFTDITEYTLPDAVQYPLMALGILFTLPQLLWGADGFHNGLLPAPWWALERGAVTALDSLIGLAAGYGLPWAFNQTYVKVRNALVKKFFNGEALESGMGMGDFKMLAWLGAFWGWGAMLGILFVAVLIMCAFVLPLHLLNRRDARTMYPLGCGLAVATPIVVFWGRSLWEYYLGAM